MPDEFVEFEDQEL